MRKYIFSNGTVRVTTGLPKPRRARRTKEPSPVIIVFPSPVAKQPEPEKDVENDDKSRTLHKD